MSGQAPRFVDEAAPGESPTSFVRCLPAVLLSAALITLSFAPSQLRPLAWVALVPLLVALRSTSRASALGLGAIWAMTAAYCVTAWLPRTVALYYGQPMWMGMALFVGAAFAMGAVYYIAFAAFYSWLGQAGVRFVPLFAGAAWAAAEFGRCRLLGGNPWGLIGYTQSGFDASQASGLLALSHYSPLQILQIADLGGVYAVSFVVVVANAATAELWISRARRWHWGRAGIDLSCAVALLCAALVYGQFRLSAGLADVGPRTDIAIVQGNIDMGSQWRDEYYGANLITYMRLTHEAIKAAKPQLVFWPENAMTFFVDAEPLYRNQIARVTQPSDVELIAGAPRHQGAADQEFFNSVFVMRPNGDISARYDKQHLLPFAEYFPFGSIDYLRRSFGRVREFTAGTEVAPLPTRAGMAGVAICNEAMFASIVRARVSAGATYLANLSNDTWIKDEAFAEQQFSLISMRAVEQRRFLVRASTSGPSGIVDPFGRVVVRTGALSPGFVTGQIRSISTMSFYGRYGDVFAWGCLIVVIGLWVIRRGYQRGAV